MDGVLTEEEQQEIMESTQRKVVEDLGAKEEAHAKELGQQKKDEEEAQ